MMFLLDTSESTAQFLSTRFIKDNQSLVSLLGLINLLLIVSLIQVHLFQ